MIDLETRLIQRRTVVRYCGPGPPEVTTDELVVETPLKLEVDGTELMTASILPGLELEFAYGALFSTGLIDTANDVLKAGFNARSGLVSVELARVAAERLAAIPIAAAASSLCRIPETKPDGKYCAVDSILEVDRADVLEAARLVQEESSLFRRTGGVHSVALFTAGLECIARADDISRHSAFDKAIGACLRTGRNWNDCFAACTCRMSTSIVRKVWRAGIPLLVSRACAFTRAVDLAESAGIALAGFARGERFSVYCCPHRIRGGTP
jgi:FdhD protein